MTIRFFFVPGISSPCKLQSIFLEYPKITSSFIKEIIESNKDWSSDRSPFPDLEILSLCRFHELTYDDLAYICGLSPKIIKPSRNLKYIRLSECEKIDKNDDKKLIRWFKSYGIDLKIDVDN